MKNWLLNHLSLLVAAVVSIFTPVTPIILTILFLVAIDFILAIYRVWRTDPKLITSRNMSNTIGKILIYTSTILSLFMLETYILGPIIPITKMVAALISFVEVKSIDETFKLLLGYSFYDKLIEVVKRGTSNTKDIL